MCLLDREVALVAVVAELEVAREGMVAVAVVEQGGVWLTVYGSVPTAFLAFLGN